MNFTSIHLKTDCSMFWHRDISANVFSYKTPSAFVAMLHFPCYSSDLVSLAIEVTLPVRGSDVLLPQYTMTVYDGVVLVHAC